IFYVPRLVRGIQSVLDLCNKTLLYSKSLDPADKPRDVGLRDPKELVLRDLQDVGLRDLQDVGLKDLQDVGPEKMNCKHALYAMH
ncbi:MAG: hypothetical protein WC627_12755, partial [Legionella sp.]